jgi:hypothetical protein
VALYVNFHSAWDFKYGFEFATLTISVCACQRQLKSSVAFLPIKGARQICDQFHDDAWQPGRQVMWSGIPRQLVQVWADRHGMQTLTTVIGPLMVHDNPQCLWSKKSKAN